MTTTPQKIVDGIPWYSPNRYWGKSSEAELLEATQVLEREGIAAFDARYKGKFDYTLDENRADWRFAVPLTKDSVVLDVGAGMGRISIPLARVVGRVVSADLSFARLQFLQTRAKQEGLAAIECVLADLYDLPFADNTFDLIVMNGVLEWVGKTDRFSNPREAQLAALRRCHAMLKPGGVLYIGIENRWAFSYLRGRDHGGLRYTNYMPRFLANAWSRWMTGEPYQTYTYGARGYRALLREAGFGEPEVYLVYPGYNLPRLLVPYANLALLRYVIEALLPARGFTRVLRRLARVYPVLWLYRAGFFSYNLFTKKV